MPAAAWGVTAPWTLLASAALGIWLMFAPAAFGATKGAADSDHLVGALVTTVAVIVMAGVIRAGRFLNVALGAWIIAAPWLLSGAGMAARCAVEQRRGRRAAHRLEHSARRNPAAIRDVGSADCINRMTTPKERP
ncbi:MAG: SPW repeat domain-containing protein [Opitutaceae bacterium]